MRSVADVLISFGVRETLAIAGETAAAPDLPDIDGEDDVAVQQELAIAAARDEGLAEGLAQAAATHAEVLEAERAASNARLAAERSRWACDEGRALAEKVALGLEEIEARIAAYTARILRGFLTDRLIDRATAELAEHIRTLLSGGDGKVVIVSGPADLVAALGETLAADAAALDLRPGASADVRIVCDDILVESRLSAWRERLAASVE